MYFKTISLNSVPIHVLADHYMTFLTLFNSSWLNFSFVSSYEMSSYLKYLSILHGWFFSLSVILWFRADYTNWLVFFLVFFLISVFFQYFANEKACLKFFVFDEGGHRSWFQEWPFLRFFSSTVCSLSTILNDVVCHKSYAQQQSCHPCDADI